MATTGIRHIILVCALAVLASPSLSFAEQGECGFPQTAGEAPVATDALFVLRAAVGNKVCATCVCDTNGSNRVDATDALDVLRTAVGSLLTSDLNCPECSVVGRVELPNGVFANEVVSTLDSVPVTNGDFELPTLSGNRQLAIAASATDEPLVMGWLGPGATVLNSRTTAEVLVYQASGGFLVPPEEQAQLVALLAEADEIAPVASAIRAALRANPSGLTTVQPALQTAIQDAVTAILAAGNPGPGSLTAAGHYARSVTRALLVAPSNTASGITLNTVSGFNEVTITNTLRRSACAFIHLVSTKDKTGRPVSTLGTDGKPRRLPESVLPPNQPCLPIPSIQKIDGLVGQVGQILNATQGPGGFTGSQAVSFVPVDLPPLKLPNVKGAARSRYRLAIVGPGDLPGDLGVMSNAERDKQTEIERTFLVKEMIIPLVASAFIPFTDLNDFFNHPFAASVVADTITLISIDAPEIWDMASKGKFADAALLGFQKLIGSGTFRDKISDKFLQFTFDRYKIYGNAAKQAASEAAWKRAGGLVSKFGNITGLVDTFAVFADASAIIEAISEADQGTLFFVDALDAKVGLDPRASTVLPQSFVTLTANVVDVSEGATLEYRFHTPGALGDLAVASGMTGTDLTSSTKFVTYRSNTTAGKENVSVEVFLVENTKRTPIGRATAVVEVGNGTVSVDPGSAQVDVGNSLSFTATADAGHPVAEWVFEWRLQRLRGQIAGSPNATPQVVRNTVIASNSDTVTFDADYLDGFEVIDVEAFESVALQLISRGKATAVAEIRKPDLQANPSITELDPGSSLSLQATTSIAPPRDPLVFRWDHAALHGLFDGPGGRLTLHQTVDHTVGAVTSDNISYTAADPPRPGTETIGVELLASTPAGLVSIDSSAARVNVACMVCDNGGVPEPSQNGACAPPGVPTEGCCGDGADNDMDGDADCSDSDCIGDDACTVIAQLTPIRRELAHNESATYTLTVTHKFDPADLVYNWTLNNPTLATLSGPVGVDTTTTSMVLTASPATLGTTSVSVTVFNTKNGGRTQVGGASTSLTVTADPCHWVRGTITYPIWGCESVITGAHPEGILFCHWTRYSNCPDIGSGRYIAVIWDQFPDNPRAAGMANGAGGPPFNGDASTAPLGRNHRWFAGGGFTEMSAAIRLNEEVRANNARRGRTVDCCIRQDPLF